MAACTLLIKQVFDVSAKLRRLHPNIAANKCYFGASYFGASPFLRLVNLAFARAVSLAFAHALPHHVLACELVRGCQPDAAERGRGGVDA